MKRLKILTWHTHASYLYYLTQAPHDFYVLSKPGRPPGYMGRCGPMPWGDNVIDLPADQAKDAEFDCIVYQDDPQYLRHPVTDRNVLLVHVTPFNELMWDNGDVITRVIDHGVIPPKDAEYTGELQRGIVVADSILRDERRLGGDIYRKVRAEVPLDLVGTGAEEAGGLGEVLPSVLPRFVSRYRFIFNPARYSGLGLAMIEAMMVGVPVVGLATTEMVTTVENGVSGYTDTNVSKLIARMQELQGDPTLARHLGQGARRRALERFHIDRFVRDWNNAFALVTR
ncbi:MAG: glycosyltransferase family 4 protein [Paucimonas sp.]|nr:glycosyltransferase family 4 protein [Paucimonas sp.]